MRLLPGPTGAATGWRGAAALDHGFDQGIPGTAFAALAGPFGEGRAAFGAAIQALGLGHEWVLPEKTAMIAEPDVSRRRRDATKLLVLTAVTTPGRNA
ncbi:hypothetical protein D3C71_1915910 [compost metagenome]